jgi:hypothetical protein
MTFVGTFLHYCRNNFLVRELNPVKDENVNTILTRYSLIVAFKWHILGGKTGHFLDKLKERFRSILSWFE